MIQKSGSQEEADAVPAPQQAGLWRYLTPAVRKAIDEARVARNRWKYTIVHNSGTRQGNARIFDYYHRHVRKMPNGLAYHFVIGNGTSSGNGQIEIGNRWVRQLRRWPRPQRLPELHFDRYLPGRRFQSGSSHPGSISGSR